MLRRIVWIVMYVLYRICMYCMSSLVWDGMVGIVCLAFWFILYVLCSVHFTVFCIVSFSVFSAVYCMYSIALYVLHFLPYCVLIACFVTFSISFYKLLLYCIAFFYCIVALYGLHSMCTVLSGTI